MTASPLSETLRRWLARPLIVFVLISIGFALGRQTAPRPTPADASPAATGQGRVVLSYLHGTRRCLACNTIQRLLQETVDHYAQAIADGYLLFREVNFDRDDTLARRYGITGSTAVLSWEHDGQEQGFITLDAVWMLRDDPEDFAAYIREEIDQRLVGLTEGSAP